jgi:hypothetical protein
MTREAPALTECKTHLDRLGAGFLGIIGDARHGYGYHLSRADIRARGNTDYSITGTGDTNGPSDTACALDVRVTPIKNLFGKKVTGWPAAPAFLRWLRAERAAGRLPEVAELIGDAKGTGVAMYAADSTGWKWVRYTGTGHVDWFHVAIYRSQATDLTFARRTFALWDAKGLIEKETPMELLRKLISAVNDRVSRVSSSHQRTQAAVNKQAAQIRVLDEQMVEVQGLFKSMSEYASNTNSELVLLQGRVEALENRS